MRRIHSLLSLITVVGVISCSGSSGGNATSALSGKDSNVSDPVILVSQIETTKLQEAIKADPVYKIEDIEIELLQKEGIITEADKNQFKAIQ